MDKRVIESMKEVREMHSIFSKLIGLPGTDQDRVLKAAVKFMRLMFKLEGINPDLSVPFSRNPITDRREKFKTVVEIAEAKEELRKVMLDDKRMTEDPTMRAALKGMFDDFDILKEFTPGQCDCPLCRKRRGEVPDPAADKSKGPKVSATVFKVVNGKMCEPVELEGDSIGDVIKQVVESEAELIQQSIKSEAEAQKRKYRAKITDVPDAHRESPAFDPQATRDQKTIEAMDYAVRKERNRILYEFYNNPQQRSLDDIVLFDSYSRNRGVS